MYSERCRFCWNLKRETSPIEVRRTVGKLAGMRFMQEKQEQSGTEQGTVPVWLSSLSSSQQVAALSTCTSAAATVVKPLRVNRAKIRRMTEIILNGTIFTELL